MLVAEFKQLLEEVRRDGVEEINFLDLQEMQQDGEDFLLIDVREPQETDGGNDSRGRASSPRNAGTGYRQVHDRQR